MPDTFSFETKEKYKAFSARRKAKLYTTTIYTLLFIVIFLLILYFEPAPSNPKPGVSLRLTYIFGCFVLIRVIYTGLAVYWVRNYIVKLTFENGIITVDYAHYDMITRYSATLDNIEIDRSINFFSLKGPSPKFEHYLSLNFLKDNIEIEQGKTLDWDDSIIDTFIGVVKHYTMKKVTDHAG
jgi:hypothetical protein